MVRVELGPFWALVGGWSQNQFSIHCLGLGKRVRRVPLSCSGHAKGSPVKGSME